MDDQPERHIAVQCSTPGCGRPIVITLTTEAARCDCGTNYDRRTLLSLPLAPRREWPSE